MVRAIREWPRVVLDADLAGMPLATARARLRALGFAPRPCHDGRVTSAEARTFAKVVAEVGCRAGSLVAPMFMEPRFRLVDGEVQIDLYNPWHLTGCKPDPDEAKLASMLRPQELGEAGYLGRVDVVRRFLAAGADPNAPEPDGVSPIQRTLAAMVTTDLHIQVVSALFDAGLIVRRSSIGSLLAETVGSEIDLALAQLLERRAR